MQTGLTGQRSGQIERRRILHVAIIAAAMLLLLITGALPGACHTVPHIPLPAKPVAVGPPAPHAATARQAAVEAARNILPKIPPRVRAAVVRALQRLPTTPLSLLMLVLVAYFFCVPRRTDGIFSGAACPLPRAPSRALLNVFLI